MGSLDESGKLPVEFCRARRCAVVIPFVLQGAAMNTTVVTLQADRGTEVVDVGMVVVVCRAVVFLVVLGTGVVNRLLVVTMRAVVDCVDTILGTVAFVGGGVSVVVTFCQI